MADRISNQSGAESVSPDADVISRQLIGRLAAVMAFISGVGALLGVLTPLEPTTSWQLEFGVAVMALVLGVGMWFAPWHRWSRRASLWVVPLGLGLIALGNAADPNPYSYGLYFVVVFLWIGLAHRRGTSLLFLPLLVGAYIGPLLTMADVPPFAFGSVAVVAVVCLLCGEAVAWVTERLRKLEVAVQKGHAAFHDGLTGLPNRALFHDRLAHAQTRARRDDGQIAVLSVDLDNFKSVNDSLGHARGDLLLIAFAQRLQAALREGDTIARFGGDEFGILVEDIVDPSLVIEIAERCLAACRAVFPIGDREVSVEMSVGVAFGRLGQPTDDLLREAEVALDAAKAKGKNGFDVFDADRDARARARQQLERELGNAVPRGELRVYYQPIVALADRHIKGVEALVRWEHPRRGIVLPAEFIPIAEETGLIVPIGQWVLEQACQQVQTWRDQYPRYASLGLSVNLSARQFQRADLVQEISRAVREAGLEPAALTLEITESAVMADPAAAATTLNELKALGFALSIDDFGTGYSSLSYLKHFPIDNLKIDRSFVEGLGSDVQDTAIVRSVVDLAQALNVSITGEGIETLSQEAALRALGCEGGQGYLFARPQNAAALEAMLGERSEHTPATDAPLAA